MSISPLLSVPVFSEVMICLPFGPPLKPPPPLHRMPSWSYTKRAGSSWPLIWFWTRQKSPPSWKNPRLLWGAWTLTKRLPNSRFETNTLLWRSLKKKIQHISDLVFFTFQEKLTDSETFPQLLAVSKELEIEVVAVATSTSDPEIRTQFDKAIKNFIWDHSKELSSIGGSGGGDRGSISGEGNKSADAKSGGELETSRDTIRPLIVLYIYIYFFLS